MEKNLVLVGMMGVGKSSVGKILAKSLKIKFVDIDKLIEKKQKMKIRNIFELKGEKFFRNEEEIVCKEYLQKTKSVIALGGGAFMNKNIRSAIFSNSISIWLDVSIKTLNLRLNKNFKRPLLKQQNNKEILEKLYDKRKTVYNLAKYKIDCNKMKINDVVKKIIKIYEKY